MLTFVHGCTNHECQVIWATKFCMMAPNICGYTVWNLMLPFWHLGFWGDSFSFFGKYLHPCLVQAVDDDVIFMQSSMKRIYNSVSSHL